ncbi:WbqC family protein [Pseudoxanthomonas helianthi]|uniref:WbqC family protein n=1 Tax=Pseudoxanthomonas helianthi TaxID=1453541 RepID=A0A940X250_9GAMM|nr:WbqC family protein [Pseudoxanthomonas helianthi]MBP3984519.1 WbqC family protein [Pseudoxanthomonas helianthi]
MLTEDEIASTLAPLNGGHFRIDDVRAYARKLLARGKVVCARDGDELVSYVLFYDDGPEAFISMVWTNPRMLRQGFATAILEGLIRKIAKPIALEVDAENAVAHRLYKKLGFQRESRNGTRERWLLKRRVAIMQPYFYPYVGYLQLVDAADFFVFYDDVHFIKRGRIHRNNILVNGQEHGFTVPIAGASQNKLILETNLHDMDRWRTQFLRQLTHAYSKAPFFGDAMGVIEAALQSSPRSIADLAIASVVGIHTYLEKPLNWVRSSEFSPETHGMEKSQRLIEITKKSNGSRYVNTPGGKKLYDRLHFLEHGVALSFLRPEIMEYRQYGDLFVPGLSVIDLMMFNTPERIRDMIANYNIE